MMKEMRKEKDMVPGMYLVTVCMYYAVRQLGREDPGGMMLFKCAKSKPKTKKDNEEQCYF